MVIYFLFFISFPKENKFGIGEPSSIKQMRNIIGKRAVRIKKPECLASFMEHYPHVT